MDFAAVDKFSSVIQASHPLTQFLERAKENAEHLIDGLPDAVAVIDRTGKLFRGNHALATMLGTDIEHVHSRSLRSLFDEAQWKDIADYLGNRQRSADEIDVEFRMPPRGEDAPRIIRWFLSPMKAPQHILPGRFWAVGHDITHVRMNEQRVARLLSNVPLAIFEVAADRTIRPPTSAFAQQLFGVPDVVGRDADQLLFGPSRDSMPAEERQRCDGVWAVIGASELQYQFCADQFPSLIRVPPRGDDAERWLGLRYHPIVVDDVVERLMVIAEDRTELELEKRLRLDQQQRQGRIVSQILAVERADAVLLGGAIEDLTSQFESVGDAVERRDAEVVAAALHTIKGTARVAGFDGIAVRSHELEDDLATVCRAEPDGAEAVAGWLILAGHVGALHDEWRRLAALCRVLREPAIEPRAALERFCRQLIAKTAESLARPTEIRFDWNDVEVDEETAQLLRPCFVHLITNAMSHGIEDAVARVAAGKPAAGQVSVEALRCDGGLQIAVADDGAGIDAQVAGKVAVDRGLISPQIRSAMADDALLRLVLTPGFSSAEAVTSTAGRGVGISAVHALVTARGGELTIASDVGRGTRIVLRFGRATEDA